MDPQGSRGRRLHRAGRASHATFAEERAVAVERRLRAGGEAHRAEVVALRAEHRQPLTALEVLNKIRALTF